MYFRLALVLFVGMVAIVIGSATASAWWWRDRTPPTLPGNLEVTDQGADYVTLSWDASFDWSFSINYRINRGDVGQSVTVPGSQTSYVWSGLESGETYSFYVEAVDSSGNVSTPSNTATGTTSGNDAPPSAPAGLTVTNVTVSTVSLSWQAASDDVGVSSYTVYNGAVPYGSVTATGPTSATVNSLAFETAYTFRVVAMDSSGQEGPPSETVTTTTLESDDATPPSAPTSLFAAADAGCGNFFLDWTESRDNVDPQWAIRYDVYMDGEPTGQSVTGDYFIEIHVDVEPDSTHAFFLRAVDRAGNVSEPSNVFLEQDNCP